MLTKILQNLKSIYRLVGLGLLAWVIITTVAHAMPSVAENPPDSLLIKGKVAYEAGQYAVAKKYWQLAQQKLAMQGDRSYQALSLNYLALASQELGNWKLAQRYIRRGLSLLHVGTDPGVVAQILNTQGGLQLAQGHAADALQSWSHAEAFYRHIDDPLGILGSQLNQAQAMQHLGFYRRSHKLLENIQAELNQESDPQIRVLALHSLGKALQRAGEPGQSQAVLEKSWALAGELNLPTDSILFSLGNTARELEHYDAALDFYQQAASLTTSSQLAVEAELNQVSLLTQLGRWQAAQPLVANAEARLSSLPANHRSIYARVNLAKNMIELNQLHDFYRYPPLTKRLLQKTIIQSQSLQDQRAISHSMGMLGHFYETQQQWSTAQKFTKDALVLAGAINADDLGYQWQWQLGRILQQQGDVAGAISAESQAVASLQKIRGDLVAIDLNAQYSFQENVAPLYRELVGLLVSHHPSQANLVQAREVIESLQLAELENYFREACLDAQPKQIAQVDRHAAVVYPIILPDRLAVIVSIAGQPLSYYEQQISQAQTEETIVQLLRSLNPQFSNQKRLELSQEIYDWIIKPVESELAVHQISTLVFVVDGNLRNLPMAALYDGEQYLVEKYSLALTPGLQLMAASSVQEQQLQAVVAGVSEANQGFRALPEVKTEVAEIAQTFSTQLLLNQDFTSQNLEQQLKQVSSPLIHLATHGQFSSNPEETFIVTWGDRIKVKDLESVLQPQDASIDSQPLELLVLSAGQMVAGDPRAALGIAGIALRSGAQSTLATLWSVEDRSTTQFMEQFYRQLAVTNHKTKAHALREAQLALMHSQKYSHPYYWAPFILVGNWL